MFDFLMIKAKNTKRGFEIYPDYYVRPSKDLMIRGGKFYAIWDEEKNLWSTDEQRAIFLIDQELRKYSEKEKDNFEGIVTVSYLSVSSTRMIDRWKHYCTEQMPANMWTPLNRKVIFSNNKTGKEDYSSMKLPYPLEKGTINAYDELMSVLYSSEERRKIEWAIGAVIAGKSRDIQKFIVLYGASGTGKSTVLNIIQDLFSGYYTVFDSKALGDPKNQFSLEQFKNNELIAIQHDGDLSKIEDNTRINSLVSHEEQVINGKYEKPYHMRIDSFIFMGTNKPVRLTDSKSGITRRLIDVSPTGELIPIDRYYTLMSQIKFELGAIAMHCKKVYEENPNYYKDYKATGMFGATNDLYNFVMDNFFIFKKRDSVSLKDAYDMYKEYCIDADVKFPLSKRMFKEDFKTYFKEFDDRLHDNDGYHNNMYIGFKTKMFTKQSDESEEQTKSYVIELKEQHSILDDILADCPAQYTNDEGTPKKKWDNVTTTLKDIDTKKLHYVRPPDNHIVIDFDIPDENGNKCLELNLEEASRWPPTYTELSKSGGGVHLHYIYTGDVSKLLKNYDDKIEIKVFTGKSAIRRKLSLCNNIDISTINSGLPLKEESNVISAERIRSEDQLREKIKRQLNKQSHGFTKPSIDYIVKILDDAYNDGLIYNIEDMFDDIYEFADNSTHHGSKGDNYCIRRINDMKLKSAEPHESEDLKRDMPLIFYDVEVKPNVNLVCYKEEGEDKKVVPIFIPGPAEIEELLRNPLVGYNNRRYDNHILQGMRLGLTPEQIFDMSQRIILERDKNAYYQSAWHNSYTDVFDFSSEKKSLKKFEIELGLEHKEFPHPWDEPLPKEQWEELAQYCANDVIATEAVFHARKADWTARQILSDISGLTVNDTTNSHTTRIIFGRERNPQNEFNYRNLAAPCDDKPYFEGYEFVNYKSYYRDCELNPDTGEIDMIPIGEGGYVYAEPGIYSDVALLDVASMHPTSIIQEKLFGVRYTPIFEELVNARLLIKHEQFEEAAKLPHMGKKLAPYLKDEKQANDLAQALKIAINSVYGLTAAKFSNPFKDPRNKDNIVAKRGALFMIDLKYAVQEQGYSVAHIKTDSIKIPNADKKIIDFVIEFGKKYGYNFEHEATYDRMCLVNNAVYIANYATVEKCEDLYGKKYVHSSKDILKDNKKHPGQWEATGAQFQLPYVFKKLFSKEEIIFDDLCETKEVKQGVMYLAPSENEKENSIFVGKIGRFCPIQKGKGGGILYRMKDDKYYAVTGTKGYEWLEATDVRGTETEKLIDISYYEKLADEAIEAISFYGDFDKFVNGG